MRAALEHLEVVTGEPALVGVMEAAKITGLARDQVIRHCQSGKIAPAVAELACGRIWLGAELKAA